MASGLWIAGGGGPPSTVILKFFSDGSANLTMGASDIGTGTKTVMAMVAAEELSIPVKLIEIVFPLNVPVNPIVPVIGPGNVNDPENPDAFTVPVRGKLTEPSPTTTNVAVPPKTMPD